MLVAGLNIYPYKYPAWFVKSSHEMSRSEIEKSPALTNSLVVAFKCYERITQLRASRIYPLAPAIVFHSVFS